jgi:formylglycine-generating enzyme required for sulfatase activity
VPDIFLSYAREDLAKAKLLATALEKQGWSVFWDRSSILTGQDFDDVIEQAIERTRCMIVGWSNAARRSDWVRGEATIGRERRILLPVLFEKVDPPIAFRGLHTEDFSAWKGELTAPAFLVLCQAIRQRLESNQSKAIDPKQTATPTNKSPEEAARQESVGHRRRKVIIGLACLLGALGIVGYWYYSSFTRPLSANQAKEIDAKTESLSVVNQPQPLLKTPETSPLLMATAKSGSDQAEPKPQIKPPEMIPIPAGEFWMGSAEDDKTADEDEKPRHKVHMAAFALGKYEVTKAQFAAFAKHAGYTVSGCSILIDSIWLIYSYMNWENPDFKQSDNDPVTCVNHDDAIAYIRWLNAETGRNFRLPTEAELEYATRAGTTSSYYWNLGQIDDNAWYRANSGNKTHPVGQKKANAFALFDMSGNVWEWTEDCWHKNYQYAPSDGSAWREENEGICTQRVLRGGSWNSTPNALRSAYRFKPTAGYRASGIGFRLAQDLP